MKKLLIMTFFALWAPAMHCMHLALENEPKRSDIVRRPFTASEPEQSSAQPQLVPAVSNEAPASRRTTNSSYRSFDRASITLPYPADDGDDQWDIVTTHDAHQASKLHKAQETLLLAQSLLPNDLKVCVKTNIHESKNPLADLETARELIWACMTRTSPHFAAEYVATLVKNFIPCKDYDPNFDDSKVYAYFAYENEVAMQEPNETFAQLIKEKLDLATEKNDEKTQWFMRQFGFMFRDPATKQTYDVYLRGGEQALQTLTIPEEQLENLQACFYHIVEAKHALRDLLKDHQDKE